MKNGNLVTKTMNELGLNLVVACQWSPKQDHVNYVLHHDKVYSIGNMGKSEIIDFFNEIHDGSTDISAKQPDRLTPVLKAWLVSLNRQDVIDMLQRQTTLKTRMNRCQLTEQDKKDLNLDILKVSDLFDMNYDMIKHYLDIMQDDDNKTYVEPLGMFLKWWVEHAMTTTEYLKHVKDSLKYDVIMSDYLSMNNHVVNSQTVKSGLKAYCKYYGIKRNIDDNEVSRLTREIEKIGVGV